MTDHSHRPDGDGLLPADDLFESTVLAAMHTTLSSAVIEAMTVMIRDADAGVTIQRATLPTILFAKEILANATQPTRRIVGLDESGKPQGCSEPESIASTAAAPPKLAPDAMREAIQAAVKENPYTNYSFVAQNSAVELSRATKYARMIAAEAFRLSAPVPPADGARLALEHAEVRFRCLSDHFKEVGEEALWAMSEVDAERMRKGIASLSAGAAEPGNAQMLEYARRLNDIAIDVELAQGGLGGAASASDLRRIAQQIVATPPVRGDRETIARIIDPELFSKYDLEFASGRCAQNGRNWAEVCYRERIDATLAKADAILSLSVQSTARPDRETAGVQSGAGEREAIIRECAEKVQSYLGATTESKRFGDEAYAMLAAFSRQAPPSSSEGGR